MNWGYHWSTSGAGRARRHQASPPRWPNYVATMPNQSKWVLGTNLYGLDWPNGGGPDNVATAMEYSEHPGPDRKGRAHSPPTTRAPTPGTSPTTRTGCDHEVWFGTAATIGRRVQLAADRGLGHRLLAARRGGRGRLVRRPPHHQLPLA